jgi:hypothetical protein
MPKNLKCHEQYEFPEKLEKFASQIKELFDTPGYCPPEEHSKPALSAKLMAAFSAAIAATASKSGVWCQNVNQNGVANNSNIYPDHEISLENLIDRLTEIQKTEIITAKDLKGKPAKKEEMELEQLPAEPELQKNPFVSCLANDPQEPSDFTLWRIATTVFPHGD